MRKSPSAMIQKQVGQNTKWYCVNPSPRRKGRKKSFFENQKRGLISRAKLTLESWIITWMNLYRKNAIELTTWENNLRQINTHIIPEIGHILLKDLTTDDVQKFYNKMTKEKFAPATVKKNHQLLSMCLSKAVKKRILNWNIAKATELPKLEDDEARAMTEEEMKTAVANEINSLLKRKKVSSKERILALEMLIVTRYCTRNCTQHFSIYVKG
ncbi:hypothetical protein SBF1_2820008 [Candidatus Desulfosporosinus infrequens]|uniref:Core-binding (CB) domain-containing protein n=1 Tax=Candidatus Desulfosporosinus infrequens TaxID=2043169 RepID=A0A2U3KUU7_9FIRM|nr:hypothetical protein SBF1_2820008 [Candidatus Desulfosporosinus infrequens]